MFKDKNTRKQIFHAESLFHFDYNTEKTDNFVSGIRQVATLITNGESHIHEVFKNILPSRLYWLRFPVRELR